MMRIISVLLLSAVLIVSAVSCGKAEKQSEETAAETVSAEDYVFDPMAGIDMTAQAIPETAIPDDWKEITDGNIALMVPSDMEGKRIKYATSDNENYVMFMGVQEWERYDESFSDEEYPQLNGENLRNAFADVGIEFDGSRRDLYRALLETTSAVRTDENAESFETIALMKSQVLGNLFPEVFVSETADGPVYVLIFLGAMTSYTDFKDSYVPGEHTAALVVAFRDENTECTALIRGSSFDTMMKMASSVRLAEPLE